MKSKNSKAIDLTEGSVWKTLLCFSIPFVFSTLLQTLYSTVDMIIVGNCVGSIGLSAISVGSELMQMFTLFCVGFCTAGQILISQTVGAQNYKRIKRINETLCLMILGISILLSVIGSLSCNFFFALLNTPAEAWEEARRYVMICSIGVLFTGFYNMFSAVFRGLGDSRHPLLFIAIASVINIILDLLFVNVLKMGAAGAALATVIGQACSVICSICFIYNHQKRFYFQFKIRQLSVSCDILKELLSLGIPITIQSCALNISFLFVSSLINELGVTVSAVFGAGQKLRNIPGILSQAIGLGAMSMVGQNAGAGKVRRVTETALWGILINAVVYAVYSAIILFYPQQMFRLFTSDEEVLSYAWLYIIAMVSEMPGKVIMPSGGAVINGIGFTRFSMILGFMDAFLGRIVLTLLFGKYMGLGVFGYFLGYTLATYVTAVPELIYFISGKWKIRVEKIKDRM